MKAVWTWKITILTVISFLLPMTASALTPTEQRAYLLGIRENLKGVSFQVKNQKTLNKINELQLDPDTSPLYYYLHALSVDRNYALTLKPHIQNFEQDLANPQETYKALSKAFRAYANDIEPSQARAILSSMKISKDSKASEKTKVPVYAQLTQGLKENLSENAEQETKSKKKTKNKKDKKKSKQKSDDTDSDEDELSSTGEQAKEAYKTGSKLSPETARVLIQILKKTRERTKLDDHEKKIYTALLMGLAKVKNNSLEESDDDTSDSPKSYNRRNKSKHLEVESTDSEDDEEAELETSYSSLKSRNAR